MRVSLGQGGIRILGAVAIVGAAFGPSITHALPGSGAALAALPARAAAGGIHGTGLVKSIQAQQWKRPQSSTIRTDTLPTTYDLSANNPTVGDQGQVGSCAAWATGYYLRGYYAIRDGYYPPAGSGPGAGFAPMYLYSRSNVGLSNHPPTDSGSSLETNLQYEINEGIDTRADYLPQGDFNWTTPPTTAEKTNAGNYKISSYDANYNQSSLTLEDWIRTSISQGKPVVIAIDVYSNFMFANSTSYLIGPPPTGSTYYGGHALFADKYDANGLWVENQWGTGWGKGGWAELTWSFINSSYTWEAVNMTPLAAPSGTATPTNTPSLTSTRTNTPTPTNTAAAAASTPTATRTNTPVSTSTLTPTRTPTRIVPTATNTPRPTNTPIRHHR